MYKGVAVCARSSFSDGLSPIFFDRLGFDRMLDSMDAVAPNDQQ